MKKTSSRSKQFYETQGYIVASVEKWNAFVGNMILDKELKCSNPNCDATFTTWKHAGIRQDLFRFADLIAFCPDKNEVLLIQSCAGSLHAEHKTKILDNEQAEAWVQSANRKIILISWAEKAPRDSEGKIIKNKDGSKKKHVWQPRIEEIVSFDFEPDPF